MRFSDPRFNRFVTALGLIGLMILSTCSLNQVGLGAKVDITPPKIQITSPAEDGTYIHGNLTLSGTASDDLGIDSLTLTYPSAAGGDVVMKLAVSGGTWSATIPTGTAQGLPEDKVTLTVSAVDGSGKATSDSLLVYVDNKAPTVLITSPISYATLAHDAPQYTDSIDIKGEVYDPSPIPKGAVKVRLLQWNRTPNPVPIVGATTDSNGWVAADGTNTFSVRFILKNGLMTASDDTSGFYYEVQAEDQAGNVNTYYYHRNDIYDVLPPNTIFPATNELGQIDQQGQGESPISFIPYSAADSTKGLTKGLIDIQLSSKTPTTAMADFQYSAVSKPKIKFSNFDQTKLQYQNALAGGSVINGTITPDLNGGAIDPKTVSVEFWSPNITTGTLLETITDTDNTNMSDNLELATFGDSLVFTVNLKNGSTALPPGPYSIKVTATAKGSTPQSETGDFIIDDNAPVLTETAIGTGALTPKNAAFTLSGTARAGAQMDKIQIFQAKDPAAVHEDTDTPIQVIDMSAMPINTDNAWASATLPTPASDGTYYYVVKLLSMSGKFASVYRTIMYDGSGPVLDITAPAAAWISTAALTLKGTADDGNGTGVEQVRVLVDDASVNHASDSVATVQANWALATGTVSWSYNWADLGAEGAKKLWVTAKDKAGNWTTTYKTVAFGLDLAPPVLTSNKSAFNLQYASLPLAMTGTASDPNGIAKLDYSLDGGLTYASLSSSTTTDNTVINWSKSVPLPANTASEVKNVKLRATDAAGKETIDSFSVTADTLAPTFSVSNLVNGQLVTSLTFSVSGTVSDNGGSGADKVQTSFDGTTWTDATLGSGTWTAPLTTTDGVGKTLSIRAQDAVGNVSTPVTITFSVDSALPSTTRTQTPAAASGLYQTAPFTISGTATDNLGVSLVDVTGNGTGLMVLGAGTTSRTWSIPVEPTSDGTFAYTITVTDISGQTKSFTTNVVYDTTAPDVSVANLVAPPATNALSDPTFKIRGSATDDNGLQSLTYQIDNGTWSSMPVSVAWSVSISSLLATEGTHTIRFKAVDTAGNSVTYPAATDPAYVFGLDLSPPTLVSNAAVLNNTNQKTSFVLSGTAQDENGIQLLEYSLDGGTTWSNLAGTSTDASVVAWSQTVAVSSDGSTDGLKALRIRATDTYAKTTVHSASVRIDASAPTFSLNNITDHQLIGSLAFTALGTVGDNGGSGVASVEYSLDGGTTWLPAVVTGSSWSAGLTLTEKLNQNLKFRATDVVGNTTVPTSGTTDLTVNVDIAPPTITNLNIPSGFSKDTFLMNFDIADSLDLASVTVTQSINGGTPVNIPITNFLSGPADTSMTNFGTTAWGLEPFPRDPAVPTTKLLNPEGEFEYVVTVTDSSGRAPVSITRKLTVDSVAPSVSIINPTAGATVNGKIAINAAASDANGIQNVRYLVRQASDASALPVFSTWTDLGNAPYSTSLDTSSFADDNWLLYVGAQDKAGNITTNVSTPFTTNQAGDIPTITLTNMNASASTLAQANANLFNSTTVTLTATASDDDDVDRNSVLIWVGVDSDPAPVADGAFVNVSTRPAADGKNVSFSHTFTGLSEGAKKMYVRVKDKAASKGGLSVASYTVGPVYFAFDSADPALSVTNKATYDGKAVNADFGLVGTTSDNNGVALLEFSLDGGSTWPVNQVSPPNTWSQTIAVPAAGASDGVKSVRVRATDGFGKTSIQTLSVTFDTIAPSSPVITAFGSPYFDTQLNASGTTSDSTSGVNKVQYSFDNSVWADLTGQDNWFGNLATGALAEGGNTLYVKAIDRAGNVSATASSPFIIDRSNPVITESAYSGVVYKNAGFAFTVDVADGLALGANALTVVLEVNGTAVTSPVATQNTINSKHHTYDFTVPVSYGEGVYQLTFHAVDSVGRSAPTVTRSVTVDTQAPSLSITNLLDGDLVQASSFTVQGTSGDGVGSGVKRVQYKLNGAATWSDATGSTSWAAALNGLTDGLTQSIVFRAEDNSGNVSLSSLTRSFKVDLAVPALSETTSTLGTSLAYRNAAVNLGGIATDGNGVDHVVVSYQKDGGASVNALDDTNNDGTWAWNLPAPSDHSADGLYDIVVTATDGAGKVSSLTRRIQIDTASPDLTITSPSASELVSTTSQKIQGQVTDNAGRGVTTLEYSKNSTNGTNGTWTAVTLTGLNWSVNAVDFSAGGEGAKTLWVRASDGINAATATSVAFNYDTQAPVLHETAVNSTNQVVSNTAVVFSGNASDTNELAQLAVSVNGGADTLISVANDGSWTSTFPNTTEGAFVLVFRATDTAGRVTSVTRNVFIDTTGPSTTIDNPGLYLSGNAGSLFGTADDGSGIGLDKVQYSLVSATGPWTDATGKNNWLVNLDLDTDGAGSDTGLPEGPRTLYVRGLDKAGNATPVASSQAFQVDQAAPSLSLYKYDGTDFVADTIYGNNTLGLTGTATDSYGVQSVGITQTKVGGNTDVLAVTLNAGTTSRSWGATADLGQGEGSYIITVTITDLVGRQTYIQKTVVKDTAAPSLPIVATPASAGQWLSGATFNFAGSAADVGSAGVAIVYYGSDVRGITPPASLGDSFWTMASGTTSWTASVNLTGEGPRSIYLKTVDKAGNVSALQTFDYGIDQSSPTLVYSLPSGNFVNGNLTLSGTASDTNSVSSVTVAEKKPGDSGFTLLGNAAYNSGTGIWSYFYALSGFDALPDGVYQYRITVTDAAGKTASYDKTITQDFVNPVAVLNAPLPTLGGPVYQANGTLTLGGTITDTNGMDALEIQVGSGAWTALGSSPFTSFSTTLNTLLLTDDADIAVSIRATDKAGNQGTTAYSLHVDQDTDKPVVSITGPAASENVQSANIAMTGTITDDDGVDTTSVQYRISYNGGSDWTAWAAIPAGNVSGAATSKSFTYTVNDPSNGSKILQIRASDTGAVVGDASSVTFTQDTGAPVLSSMTPAEGTATNASSFVVTGTATDSAAVISVTYRVLKDGVQLVATTASSLGPDTDPGVGETRSFTTPPIDTTSGSGNYQVQLVSSDGTNTRQENINVVVDRTAPSVAFSSPAAGSTNNNVITLSGTASDNRLLSTVALEIWKSGAKVANVPGTVLGTSNWTLSFNTADFDDAVNATLVSGNAYDITLRAVAIDAVGNTGATNLTFRIDQDTDKPVIAVSTAQSPTYLSAFSVNGTAADDDGIASIEVSQDGSSWTSLTAPGGGWTKNSSWNTSLAAGDGAKTLYIRVTDSSTPGIVTTSTAYHFLVDQEAPDGGFTSPAVNSKLKTGEFTFTGTFADENTVTAVKLKVDSSDFSSNTQNATFTAGLSGTWTYTFSASDLSDGVRTIYLQVTDASGKTTTVTRAVTVDKTAPVVTISEPTSGSSAFGLVRLRGSALDATSGVKNVKIGLGKTINTADWDNVLNTWYPATGTVSWEYVINNINSFANATYATDLGDTNGNGVIDGTETAQNIWRMFLYIRAEDTAGSTEGNVSVVSTYYLEVDPLRDRPEITVLQPVDAVSTVGGFLRIVGSAYDTNYIAKNQIAFDMDNNGSFSDAGDVWPTVAPSVDQTDASTTAWYAMTGTTSWSTVINNSGEFNPTGGATTKTIKFKVRSVDSKVAHGGTPSLAGLEQVYTVTFSNQVPQYSNINLSSNDTIGGTVVLTGYVKVPSLVGMSSIRFNHDGPRLSSTELIGGAAGMRAVLLTNGDSAYEAGYDKYSIEATINTNDADLFLNNAGSMTVSLRSYDNSAFQSFQTINLSVDNKAPTAPSFTALTEISGTAALVQGQVTDSGVVSGIKKVVFYLQQGTNVYRLKGGSNSSLTNAANQVLDLTNAAYNDYRIVVDKTTEGGNDAGAGGDGDGFNESLTSSFGTYNWNATFDSTLVTDGRYDAKFTAYDTGNNSTTFTQSTFVANNKPSITSIELTTDLDGSGSISAGEGLTTISANYTATNYTGRNSKLGFKINTAGGNGVKHYSILRGTTELNTGTLTGNSLVVDTSNATNYPEGPFSFTIRVFDSTNGVNDVDFDDLSATVTVGVIIDNVDDIAPAITIAPFGQKYPDADNEAAKTSTSAVASYNDNIRTIYPLTISSSTTTSITTSTSLNGVLVGQTLAFAAGSRAITSISGSTLNWASSLASAPTGTVNVVGKRGHVEYAATSSYNGTDADISGEVTFKGKVSDNQKINRITAAIPGFNGGSGVGAEFDLYTYAGGALSGTGWAFAVDGAAYLTEANGNLLNWNFTWNSALITTVANNNVTITLKVYDAKPNSSTSTLTVDVVPYVQLVTTKLSSAYTATPSAINRSASGRYPVQESETITLSGYNFNGSSTNVSLAGTTLTPTGASTSYSLVVPIGATAVSGAMTVTVNSVPDGNGTNDNTQTWNSLANGVNNALLVDDLSFYVWQFNAVLADTTVRYPRMRVSTDAAQRVGFSFDQGAQELHVMDAGTNTKIDGSYTQFYDTGFAYDGNGKFYAMGMNGDSGGSGGTTGGNAAPYNTYANGGFYAWTAGNAVANSSGAYTFGTNKVMLESSYNGTTFNSARVQEQKIVAKETGTGNALVNLYTTYWDDTSGVLKFRWGTVTGAAPVTFGGNIINRTNTAPGSATGSHTLAAAASGTYRAGLYSAVGVTSTGVAVAAWYDATNQSLVYSYNTAPTGATTAQWQTNATVIDSNFAGWYVDLVVDAADHIHLAYYAAGGGDLKYAYIPSYNAAASKVVNIVDSWLSTGSRISISVKLDGGNYVPYISYAMPAFTATAYATRVAWRSDMTGNPQDGAVNDAYTQKWEVMTIPTSNIPKDYTVGVGFKTLGTATNSALVGYATNLGLETAGLK